MFSAISSVIGRAVDKTSQNFTFKEAVEQTIYKLLLPPHIVEKVTRRAIASPAFTIPVAELVENEIERRFFEKYQFWKRH